MPVDTITTLPIFDSVWLIIKLGLFILGILYFIFSLIVVQQVRLMTISLITEVSPVIRFFSLIHVGFSIAVLILLFGMLFG